MNIIDENGEIVMPNTISEKQNGTLEPREQREKIESQKENEKLESKEPNETVTATMEGQLPPAYSQATGKRNKVHPASFENNSYVQDENSVTNL